MSASGGVRALCNDIARSAPCLPSHPGQLAAAYAACESGSCKYAVAAASLQGVCLHAPWSLVKLLA